VTGLLRLSAALLAAAVLLGDRKPAEAGDAAACRTLLDRTLAAMDARPSLKEEFATGLMWMRLDALKALEAGDTAGCLAEARRAAALLGAG
jgi:hypothetical protein